jgi:hypothetical protein
MSDRHEAQQCGQYRAGYLRRSAYSGGLLYYLGVPPASPSPVLGFEHLWFVPFAALLAFVIYRRFRRNFGIQPLRRSQMTFRIVLFAVVAVLLLNAVPRTGAFLLAGTGGAALGIALGVYAAMRTRFEYQGNQLYYIPHTYTGLIVFSLFIGRLLYRFGEMYQSGYFSDPAHGANGAGADSAIRSPLTLGMIALYISYGIYLYSRLLWKSRHLTPGDLESPSIKSA